MSMGPMTSAPAELDYGAFMRSTTPQERVEAITRFLSVVDLNGELTAANLDVLFSWLVEAAGPQGYEVVPLDWIRKLRQAKDAARNE